MFKESKEFYSCYHIKEDTRNELFSDKFEFHIIELPKLRKYKFHETLLYNWLKFFDVETREELDTMYGKDNNIDKACDKIKEMSADEQLKLEYEVRQKIIRDQKSNQYYFKTEGLREGFSKGEIKLLISLIRLKLSDGITREVIAKDLYKPIEEINQYVEIINQFGSDFTDEEIANVLYEKTHADYIQLQEDLEFTNTCYLKEDNFSLKKDN